MGYHDTLEEAVLARRNGFEKIYGKDIYIWSGGISIHMIIVLLGASGSGKSTIENELATHHGFEKIIS